MSDYITEDNLVLILKHLPVKTLLQFRSVCKEWKRLIDSPSFVLDHLSVQTPTFIVQNGSGRKLFAVDPHRPLHSVKSFDEPEVLVKICGTLHGIVCLYQSNCLFLWNPSIRKILSIQVPTPIAFSTHGFWITPSTKEFKIMFLLRRPWMTCFLYSSVGANWSIIPIPWKVERWKKLRKQPPAVMIGDVAHWGGCLNQYFKMDDWDDWDHVHENTAILSFDFVKECFEIIELDPPDVYSRRTPFRLKDTLSLACLSTEFPHKCKIFMRRDDSWVGMFCFEVSSHLLCVFWAMEDLKVGRRGKGKRKTAEAQAQENVRILATAEPDFERRTCKLVLEGTRSGCKTVKKGVGCVTMAYDFVESLLFP